MVAIRVFWEKIEIFNRFHAIIHGLAAWIFYGNNRIVDLLENQVSVQPFEGNPAMHCNPRGERELPLLSGLFYLGHLHFTTTGT
ncbi:MAG: hypothetical protein H7096_04310 [Flavobacterium sp.]|nr:hypothetical protein [Pedobacter sp.]